MKIEDKLMCDEDDKTPTHKQQFDSNSIYKLYKSLGDIKIYDRMSICQLIIIDLNENTLYVGFSVIATYLFSFFLPSFSHLTDESLQRILRTRTKQTLEHFDVN